MKTRIFLSLAITILLTASVLAQEVSIITVEDIQICTSVENRQPIGTDTSFPQDVERLYCFTKLRSDRDMTSVSHVWYYNDKEMAKVDLVVNAKTWRTYSSKRILKSWTGEWRVDILSATGELLASKEFDINPAMSD
jgi:hypothetical protein